MSNRLVCLYFVKIKVCVFIYVKNLQNCFIIMEAMDSSDYFESYQDLAVSTAHVNPNLKSQKSVLLIYTLTTAFPKFSPRNMFIKACGVFSNP